MEINYILGIHVSVESDSGCKNNWGMYKRQKCDCMRGGREYFIRSIFFLLSFSFFFFLAFPICVIRRYLQDFTNLARNKAGVKCRR